MRQYGEQDTSLRGLARLAQEGHAILIFPQGKHILPEAERAGDPDAHFRPGVGHLASALDATVVPFGLAGTEVVFPNVDRAPLMIGDIPVVLRKGPVAIVFGAPLEMEPNETPTEFARRLQERLLRADPRGGSRAGSARVALVLGLLTLAARQLRGRSHLAHAAEALEAAGTAVISAAPAPVRPVRRPGLAALE